MKIGRRVCGIFLCELPVWALLASLIKWSLSPRSGADAAVGIGLSTFAFAIGCLNFYLYNVRFWIWQLRKKDLKNIRFISGIPLIGSLMAFLGAIWGFGSIEATVIGLVAVLIDVVGSPWIPLVTWNDTAFWGDAPGD